MSDGWQPAFPGQRPPFRAGNTAAVRHGATSAARVGELAGELLAALLEDEETPPYLLSPTWRPQVVVYARQMAVVELLWAAVAELDDVTGLLTEVGQETSNETVSKGGSQRVTASRRTAALLTAWNLATGRLRTLAADLGLTPASHVKITQQLASAEYLRATGGRHALDIAVDRQLAEDQRRRELDAGGP